MESLVLPLELPLDAGGGGCVRKIGKGIIDWSGEEKSKHIDTIPEWGPYYRIAFDLFLNSEPPKKEPLGLRMVASVLDFRATPYGKEFCYQCFKLETAGSDIMLVVDAQSYGAGMGSGAPFRVRWKGMEIKKWYKIELKRRPLEAKVNVKSEDYLKLE